MIKHKITGHLVFELHRPNLILRGYYDEKKKRASGNWDYPYQLEITTKDGVEYKTANNPCIFERIGVFNYGDEQHTALFDNEEGGVK